MKRIILTCTSIAFCTVTSLAQTKAEAEPSNNYYKMASTPIYGVYVLGGITMPYTDVGTQTDIGYSFGAQAQIRATYFLDAALDVQWGKLSAGDNSADFNNRLMKFKNQTVSVTAVARLSPLKLLSTIVHKSPLYYISGLYVGTGVGLLKSKVTANRFSNPDFVYIGNYSGTDLMIPVEFGINAPLYESKTKKSISLNLNYRFGFMMTDKVDGYVTPVTLNDKKDVYNVFNIGIGYSW